MIYKTILALIGCILLVTPNVLAGVITFKPHLSVSTEYTDNSEQSDIERQEEYSIIVSPGFIFSLSQKHTGINLSYTPGYLEYQETDKDATKDTTWRHDASLSFWKDLSKYTTLKVADRFNKSDRPVYQLEYDTIGYVLVDDQLIPVVDTTFRQGKNQYEANTANASLTHKYGKQNEISISYSQSYFKELEIEGGNDNEHFNPTLSITHWITPHSGFDFSAGLTHATFKNSDNFDDWQGTISFKHELTKHLQTYINYKHSIFRADENSNNDYELYAPSMGISYQIEKDISLNLGGGYFFRYYENGFHSGSPFLDGSINKSWSFHRGSAHLTGSAGLDRKDLGDERRNLKRFYGFGARASYSLTKRIQTSINASGRRHETLDIADDNITNYAQAGCTLSYTPRHKWFSISASYTHRLLDSTIEENNYHENSIQVNLSIAPNYIYRHVY